MADTGVCVVTHEKHKVVKKLSFNWTSDGSGDVVKTLDEPITGEIIRLVTVPGTAGDQPSDLYDITIEDEDGTDILMGAGANRSNAATEQVLASSLGCIAYDSLVFKVAAAGDTNKGQTYLYYRG